MTLRLEWNSTFSVGVELLDGQHRLLFEIANSIPETVDEQRARICIVRLFKYTREHFLAEEAEMRRMGYPKVAHHTELHNHLLNQLCDISVKPLDSDEVNLEFKRFVFHWIVDHILLSDQDYHRYATEHP